MNTAVMTSAITGAKSRRPAQAPATSNARLKLDMVITLHYKVMATLESMLTDLKQRIRDIRQGPDGLIYVLTDENHGAILKLEPLPKDEKTTAPATVR